MQRLILLLLCLLLGIFLRGRSKRHVYYTKLLSRHIIFIAFPASILLHVKDLYLDLNTVKCASMVWFQFVTSALFFYAVTKYFRWSTITFATLLLTTGLANTSFVGFPLLEAIIGHEAIPTAILIDQFGTFLTFSTLGIVVANLYSPHNKNLSAILMFKKIITFPPMLTLLFAFLLKSIQVDYPLFLTDVFKFFSSTLAPVALLAVGFQISFVKTDYAKYFPKYFIGILFRLVLFPAVIYLTYQQIFNPHDLQFRVVVLEAGMATQLMAAILCIEEDLDAKLASMMVGFSVPISFITVALWNRFI